MQLFIHICPLGGGVGLAVGVHFTLGRWLEVACAACLAVG